MLAHGRAAANKRPTVNGSMPKATRNPKGRFKSSYSAGELYELICDVCRFVQPDEPLRVTQRAFNLSRAAAGHPGAPLARVVVARLKGKRDKFGWSEAKAIALDPNRDLARSDAIRTRAKQNPDLDWRHVHYALNRAATALGVRTLTPGQYAKTREQLIAKDRRRRNGGTLEELLPTAGQIEWISGGWDEALAGAGLEPRPKNRGQRGISVIDALDYFADETGGCIVGWNKLHVWAGERGIALEHKPKPEQWKQALIEVEVGREQQGKPFFGMPVQGQILEHTIPDHEYMHLPRRRIVGGEYTREEVYEKLLEWDDSLDSKTPRDQRQWQRWASGRPRTPALHVVQKHGRLGTLLGQARRRRRAQQNT